MTYEFPTWVVFGLSNTRSSPSLVSGITSRRSDSRRDTFLAGRRRRSSFPSRSLLSLRPRLPHGRRRGAEQPSGPPKGTKSRSITAQTGGSITSPRPSSGPVSAWLRARGPSAGELGNSISTLLISPNFAFPSLKAQDESNASAQFAARRSDRYAEQPLDRLADLGGEQRRKPRPSPHAPDRSRSRADLCRLPGRLVLGDAVSAAATAQRGFLTKPLHRGVDKRPLIG